MYKEVSKRLGKDKLINCCHYSHVFSDNFRSDQSCHVN